MPRFQFTIRRLLWAIFWFNVSAAGYALVQYKPFGEQNFVADFVGFAACGIGPFFAFGILFGHWKWGALLGVVLFVLWILSIIIRLATGESHLF